MAKAKEETTAKKGAAAVPATKKDQLPSTNVISMDDMIGDAGAGMENVTAKDVAIPYLAILQSNSPQVKKGANRIEGAEEGDFYNTVTQEIFSGEEDGLALIHCGFQKKWVEWVPRDSGGGLVRQYDDDSLMAQTHKNEQNKDVLPNGNLLVETAYHFCLLIKPDNTFERVVVSFTSTQLKKSRRWNSIMMNLVMEHDGRKFNPPTFSHMYPIHTQQETKDTNSWFGWDIGTQGVRVEDATLYNTAKKFAQDVNKGVVKAAEPVVDGEVAGTAGGGEAY